MRANTDDTIILDLALDNNYYIITKDLYGDHIKSDKNHDLREFVKNCRVTAAWIVPYDNFSLSSTIKKL